MKLKFDNSYAIVIFLWVILRSNCFSIHKSLFRSQGILSWFMSCISRRGKTSTEAVQRGSRTRQGSDFVQKDKGFQFDYVFDWTIIKHQQSQTSRTQPRLSPVPGASISHGVPKDIETRQGTEVLEG